jgi:hypothetical protein
VAAAPLLPFQSTGNDAALVLDAGLDGPDTEDEDDDE